MYVVVHRILNPCCLRCAEELPMLLKALLLSPLVQPAGKAPQKLPMLLKALLLSPLVLPARKAPQRKDAREEEPSCKGT